MGASRYFEGYLAVDGLYRHFCTKRRLYHWNPDFTKYVVALAPELAARPDPDVYIKVAFFAAYSCFSFTSQSDGLTIVDPSREFDGNLFKAADYAAAVAFIALFFGRLPFAVAGITNTGLPNLT